MNDSPLVTPAWLDAHARDPGVVIVDARWYLKGKRGIDEYRAGHIPGALFVDVDRDLASPPGDGRNGRHPLPTAEAFADVLAHLGVGPRDIVVAYDDSGGATAARVWWLLRYFGLLQGKVLDGGIQAWVSSGHPLETSTSRRLPSQAMELTPRGELVVDKARVQAMVLGQPAVLLDARARERYEGKIEPVDARPGHIPGAKSAPFVDNLVAPGGPFRSPEELASLYASLGATGAEPIVAYCGSGVTACHDILALSLAGWCDALLYEGSWSDWAADATLPAALGSVPG